MVPCRPTTTPVTRLANCDFCASSSVSLLLVSVSLFASCSATDFVGTGEVECVPCTPTDLDLAAKDGKEKRQNCQSADEVEGIVGPGQLWGEGDPFWRTLFSCEDEVGEGGRENGLRMVDKKEDEALP